MVYIEMVMRMLKKKSWPYRIVLDDDEHNHDIKQVESWLAEHMGAFRERYYTVYLFDETHFYFRNQRDAAWFALRWS